MRGYKKLVKSARQYLKSINNKIDSLPEDSDEFYVMMRGFYDFFNQLNNVKMIHFGDLKLPEDIETMVENISIKFKIKNFKDDEEMWLKYIQDNVKKLLILYNSIPKNIKIKEKRIIHDSIQRHYKYLQENIDYYKNTFLKSIPKSTEIELKKCIRKILVKHKMYIKTKEDILVDKINCNFIDFDQAIDLYEKIKISKGVKKNKLQKELNKLIQILKED